MGKRKAVSFIITLIDIFFHVINFIIYVFCFSTPIIAYNQLNGLNNKPEYLLYIITAYMFVAFACNALIQNFTFDRKFMKVLASNKTIVTDFYGLPPTILIKLSLMRAIFYSAAITTTKTKRFSWAPIVNHLANNDEFSISTRQHNKIMAWMLYASVPIVFIGGGLCVIMKYTF